MGNPVVHFEIQSTDGAATAKFYSELFGWHFQEIPEMNYRIVDTHAGDGINGGIGQPPGGGNFTTFYAEGDDLQALLDKAESLGGKTLMPVSEVPGAVTLAMFADPQGNTIGLVKSEPAQEGPGVSSGNKPSLSWFEVLGTDAKALRDFYATLFDWEMTKGEAEGIEYYQVDARAGKGIAGGIGASPTGDPMVTLYAKVDDLKNYLDRAEALGGKAVTEPMDVGAGTSIAHFADPTGNIFGIYTTA
jgi:predicted enzyme related to lactoylglutathione lyase